MTYPLLRIALYRAQGLAPINTRLQDRIYGTVRGRCARLGNSRTHLSKDLTQNGNQRCHQEYVGKDDEYEHELYFD